MLTVQDLTLQFGKRVLFDEADVFFAPGNCYGVIGANGSGKSTFLKILAGKKEANKGTIKIEPNKRMAVLKQDHFEYDDVRVIDTVMMGHQILWSHHAGKRRLICQARFF